MHIAITGSTGLIGTGLKGHLEANGHTVLPVIRGGAAVPTSTWDPGTGWIRPGAFDGVDAVVHLAGASIADGRWSEARKRELLDSRVNPTRLLVSHLAAMPNPPALLNASAVGFYGSRGDESLTEESARGTGFLSDITVAWEKEAEAARAAGIRTSILRFGVVLSKHGGALPRMMMPFKFGAGGPLGRGKQWMSWVTLDDVVGSIQFLVAAKADGVYNVTAPRPVTNADFTKALGKAMHRPALFPVPPVALRLALGESADELLFASQRVTPAHLTADGYAFKHPDIASGLNAVLHGGS